MPRELTPGFATWLIFGDPEPPIPVRLYPDDSSFGLALEGFENFTTNDQIPIAIFSKQNIGPIPDQMVNDVVLIDATVTLELREHPA